MKLRAETKSLLDLVAAAAGALQGRAPGRRIERHGYCGAISEWPWADDLDGVVAAPGSHRVLLEAPGARVLEVRIEPGKREPEHTHRLASVMIADQPARIRYTSAVYSHTNRPKPTIAAVRG